MPLDSRVDRNNPHLFMDLLAIRKEKNMDSTIIFVGERRSGKSYASISLAEALAKRDGIQFEVKKNLFFEPLGFLKRFQQLEGEAIILDEASISIDSRTWFEASNRIINSVLLREGFKRNYIIFTLPNLSDLDKRAIRLCSHLITMFGHSQEKMKSFGVCYRLKALALQGKTFPRKIQMLPFSLPSKKNRMYYDQMKKDWNLKVSGRNIEFMEMIENPETYEKPLGKDYYIKALSKGKLNDERFIKSMAKCGVSEQDSKMLISMYEQRDDAPIKQDQYELIYKPMINRETGSKEFKTLFIEKVAQRSSTKLI